MMTLALLAMGITFVIALGLSGWLARHQGPLQLLDRPNERSLHNRPVPRTGGIAMTVAVIAGLLVFRVLGIAGGLPLRVLLAVATLGTVALADDLRGVPPLHRLVVQTMAAVFVVVGGDVIRVLELPGLSLEWAPWIGGVFTVLFLVWMTNLYNFMDGMNGFAAGMSVVGFMTLALLGWRAGDSGLFLTAALLAAAAAGFLVHNFSGRIFMGDLGSSTLGFLAGGLSVRGAVDGIFPLWVPVLLFSPFIVDATVTLLIRLFQRAKVWTPHRDHFYQRLVRSGWTHRKTVLWEYLIMSGAAISSLLWQELGRWERQLLLGGWVLVYGVLMILILSRTRVELREEEDSPGPDPV